MHSVKNMLFANDALNKKGTKEVDYKLFADISNKKDLQTKVLDHALKQGMIYIDDHSGSNIDVQIIDLAKTELKNSVFGGQKYNLKLHESIS